MTARAAKLVYGYRLLAELGEAEKLAVIFDETPSGRGLERGTFQRFRARLFDLPDRVDLIHFAKYEMDRASEETRSSSATHGDPWLEAFWRDNLQEILAILLAAEEERSWRDSELVDSTAEAIGWATKSVARPVGRFLGGTKIKRPGHTLISQEQIEEMLPLLEPGDIFLEKTAYTLSNAFITGFWGHTGLYVGSFEEAAQYFDTPEVNRALARHGHQSFAALVTTRFPRAVQAWREAAEDGSPRRVLEGNGVKETSVFFNTAQDAFDADYIAVLRPRLTRLDKALAVVDALAYWRAEYDFDFDVRSDTAVVCTELLAYVVYPNAIAERFAKERGSADRRFDFITFLRALEGTRRAEVASEEIFSQSHTWDSIL